MNVIETSDLGKRYGSTWALRECTVAIPAGHVTALVGPNGAGKTTLLNLAAGLAAPSAGGVTVLGGRPAGSPAALDDVLLELGSLGAYRPLWSSEILAELDRVLRGLLGKRGASDEEVSAYLAKLFGQMQVAFPDALRWLLAPSVPWQDGLADLGSR